MTDSSFSTNLLGLKFMKRNQEAQHRAQLEKERRQEDIRARWKATSGSQHNADSVAVEFVQSFAEFDDAAPLGRFSYNAFNPEVEALMAMSTKKSKPKKAKTEVKPVEPEPADIPEEELRDWQRQMQSQRASTEQSSHPQRRKRQSEDYDNQTPQEAKRPTTTTDAAAAEEEEEDPEATNHAGDADADTSPTTHDVDQADADIDNYVDTLLEQDANDSQQLNLTKPQSKPGKQLNKNKKASLPQKSALSRKARKRAALKLRQKQQQQPQQQPRKQQQKQSGTQ